MSQYTQAFLRAINFVIGIEGKLSMDPEDPGNWTGGEQGKGELKGTKWGISAAAYPLLDIAALTRDQAIGIYWRDYWAIIKGDQMAPPVGLAVLDCAVNQGVDIAAKFLQTAVGVEIDGVIGPDTLAAARRIEPAEVVTDFLARRAVRYAGTKNFARNGRGWMRRLMMTAMEAFR